MKIKSFLFRASLLLVISSQISCTEIDPDEPGALVPKTVEQDPSLPSIEVNGTMLHSETFGNPNNSMLVFLHGGPGGDYRNGLNVKQLADDGYYVVFFDQRSAGLSKRHNKNTFSIQQTRDDLTAVIEYYKTSPDQKVFLFGHSWGAILATSYINSYPERISGVILAEAGGMNYDDLKEYQENSRRLSLFSEATNDALYLDQFFTGTENQHEVLDYKLAVLSSFTYAENNDEGIEGPSPFWRNGAVVLNSLGDLAEKDGFDFTKNLNQYTTKVLLIYGQKNKSYGLSFAQKEADYFSNSEIQRIDGTGHEMIYFKWENVYPKVLEYLNALN